MAPTRPADAADPQDPAYRWTRGSTDQAVAEVTKHGMTVALMLKSTPSWANGDKDVAWAPDDAKDYARFVEAAAKRYPSVRLWMVWGETDSRLTFKPAAGQ